jgi:hypothetical protein
VGTSFSKGGMSDNPMDGKNSVFANHKLTPRRNLMDKTYTQMSPRDSICSGATSFRQKFKTLQNERANVEEQHNWKL